ncbi:hypothetical protein [Streptacidiphilus sp. P02-A3a]|uniref:hypothetical protein n=1 Tax=Streptacidiphilus sp. P02-A3a TaxID=2704468 RepID=UPI001CDC9F3B|nr:hypothetical protein [Streptacidiphilus sp. P02-A3a]
MLLHFWRWPVRSGPPLDLYDLPPDETIQPRSLATLRKAVATANKVGQAANYGRIATRLPALLAELHTAAHLWTGRDQVEVWGLLAEAYRLGHTYAIAMRMPDLSAVALTRMDWAAAQAGDRAPGLRAAREYLRVTAYLREKDYAACERLNASGVRYLDGTDERTPGALVARGQLHLGASVIAARQHDDSATKHHLTEAQRMPSRSAKGTGSSSGLGSGQRMSKSTAP